MFCVSFGGPLRPEKLLYHMMEEKVMVCGSETTGRFPGVVIGWQLRLCFSFSSRRGEWPAMAVRGHKYTGILDEPWVQDG